MMIPEKLTSQEAEHSQDLEDSICHNPFTKWPFPRVITVQNANIIVICFGLNSSHIIHPLYVCESHSFCCKCYTNLYFFIVFIHMNETQFTLLLFADTWQPPDLGELKLVFL